MHITSRLLTVINLTLIMLLTVFPSAFAGMPGSVNWNEGYVEAVGMGTSKPSDNKGKARINARRAAEVAAQRALLEIIKGVRITSKTTVSDLMLEDDIISSRVEGIVKGAHIVAEKLEWEGSSPVATVVMRVCLMGGTSCKGTPVQQVLGLEKIPEPSFVPQRSLEQYTPPEVTAPNQQTTVSVYKPSHNHLCDLNKKVTGLVISLGGRFYERNFYPVVISEAVNSDPVKIYSPKIVKPAVYTQFGVVRYADTVSNAITQGHISGNPLIITVKDFTRDGMLVISARDTVTIKETLAHGNNYLEDAKVVISAQ